MKNYIPRVGLVMKSLNADFFKVMKHDAEKYVEQNGCCELISTGTENQTDVEGQLALVEQLADQGVDAIVVVPIDSKALVAPVVKAVRRGIRVVNIDIRLDEDLLKKEGVQVDFVGPDNYGAAKAVGEVLAESLNEGDKVVMIEGLPVADNARQRKAGFDAAIAERKLDCVASEPANWETSTAKEVFTDLYAKYHEGLKGVFCCNDAMALGVIDVLKANGREPGEIKVVGFDNDDVMTPLLKQHWLLATVDAFGSQMAVEGIKHALELLREGKNSIGSKATPFELVK